jgi:hypothetical protein
MEGRRRDWGLIVWIAAAMLAIFVLTALTAAWSVRHALANGKHFSVKQRHLVLAVADFPSVARDAVIQMTGMLARSSNLMLDRAKTEKPYWVRRFPAPEDTGFVLLSGLDPATGNNTVKLVRIADGSVLARWTPDWNAVYASLTDKKFKTKGGIANAQAFHPLALRGGDIVFNTAFGLVRLSPCSGKPVWVVDKTIHHSNELDDEGTIWTGGVSDEGFSDNEYLKLRVRDDALVRVSLDGQVLERYSIARILRTNDLESLLMGTNGEWLQPDPIHLNQVRKAERDTPYWKRGDLLVSMRHLSTVMLYRPSTGKIVWYQQGPWLNQHDADFVDDHRISIFDNNVYSGAPEDQPFMVKGDTNQVYIYDFATHEAAQPYARLLAQARPATMYEGRARVLPDGGLFLEESGSGRLLRFTPDRLLWSFVNDYDANRIGVLSWSRYLTAEEAAPFVKDLAARKCAAP